MRNVVYTMLASIDGFIATPDGGLDWVTIDDEMHTFVNDTESNFDTHLYGRRMYETMAATWPAADQVPGAHDFEAEYARIWREMPKVVFSTTLKTVDWNARLVRNDIAGEVARLKGQPGKDMSVSGAKIAASFMRLGLVDACQIYLQPVVLGRGIPMFPDLDCRINMQLVATRSFNSGVVFLHYRRTEDQAEQTRNQTTTDADLPAGLSNPARHALATVGITQLNQLTAHRA